MSYDTDRATALHRVIEHETANAERLRTLVAEQKKELSLSQQRLANVERSLQTARAELDYLDGEPK